MQCYRVLPALTTYQPHIGLCYLGPPGLASGQVVLIEVGRRLATGLILGSSSPPTGIKLKTLQTVVAAKLPKTSLDLMNWLLDFYPGPGGQSASLFMPSAAAWRPAAPEPTKTHLTRRPGLLPLTNAQKQALKELCQSTEFCLLHGDTGSGKTRLYIELASAQLAAGRSVVILTPEIGLTAQLFAQLAAAFEGPLHLIHSGLPAARRYQIWRQLAACQSAQLVIGPRSALFMPLKNIGLIVMDEAHDAAYKHERAPRYQTTLVAAKAAHLHGARLVLGTATPLVSDWHLAVHRNWQLVRLKGLADSRQKRHLKIDIIDLRQHKPDPGAGGLSVPLQEALKQTFQAGQQSLLLLNRRGTARLIFCPQCGWRASCPACDMGLTYHDDRHQLQCHLCGQRRSIPMACPICHNSDILYSSPGTKALSHQLACLLPGANIRRFDTDNPKDESLASSYPNLLKGTVDILVGTQMISKGLHLPKLTLVGVVSADTGLLFPDYLAEERTFQLLHQVVGRAGRGEIAGRAIIQTFNPASAPLIAVAAGNWRSFAKQQLADRLRYRFPPYCYLLKLSCRRRQSVTAAAAARQMVLKLEKTYPGVSIHGPSPAFHARTAGFYCWQIILKSARRSRLTDIVKDLPSGWTSDLDPISLL